MAADQLRILLVENDSADRQLVAGALASASGVTIHIETADCLGDAVQRLRSGGIDAVVVDLHLPDSDGPETCSRLHRSAPDMPIVALSETQDERSAIEALERGAQDYLVKGQVDGAAISRSLRYALSRNRAFEELRRSEERLRLVCGQLPAVIWTTDLELRFTSSEGTGLEALRLESGQAVGTTVYDYFGTDRADFAPVRAHRRALAGRSASFDLEWMDRTWHVHIEPLRDRGGAIQGAIGVALDVSDRRRMEASLGAAEEVQKSLYPSKAPVLERFEIAGDAFPAEETAGDYFDFIPMADGGVGLVVGDVSGHGLPAALLMIELRAYLRSVARLRADVAEILNAANALVVPDIADHRFITLFLGKLDPRENRLEFAGAGHPGYVLEADGSLRVLASTGFPLGMVEDAAVRCGEPVELSAGDVVLLATDGFHESLSPDRELFGMHRVLDCLREHRSRPAADMIAALKQAVDAHTQGAPQRDDMSAIVVKVLE
ncbi:MAG: SpoIIE family protein phosphatase [Planctomycetes bacterium]|nr:SpoIIE family protein phosphatase [Planctomycetota bacterium]